MSRTITIDPVTRIEGHARITIQLDDAGSVEDAHLHITQMRGFEQVCIGRPLHEMPSLMARVCGICPVSHLMAAAKAGDALLAVRIPPTAAKLRRIMNLAQIAQSHALSFFYLSAPDLLLGMDADPAARSIFGIAQAAPELAHGGIALRKTGQTIIELLGGKRIHPAWVVPGGVSEPLSEQTRDRIAALIPEALAHATEAIAWFGEVLDRYLPEIESFANFPTLYMGLVNDEGTLELYDGRLRMAGQGGGVIEEQADPLAYQTMIGEAVEPHSYLKSPFYKRYGYPDGIYRVGPLARLNIIDRPGTPLADEAFKQFKHLDPRSSFHYHYARLIEIVACLEQIERLLEAPDILSHHVRAFATPNAEEGVGISEAPRGTLIHHYRVDRDGLVTYANLIIATGHNNLAMERGVLQVARRFVKGDQLQEGMLNRVEALIRAFDPCFSCSTHAAGQMPLHVRLVTRDGSLLDEQRRG
jgi:NAD-reducing hydrogenase large subunit